jgi:chlorite dismutase
MTLEGASVLHQMMRFRWREWKALPDEHRSEIAEEAAAAIEEMERPGEVQSAAYSLLGHKGDLMFVHFRQSFEQLNRAELRLARLSLSDYLEPTTSYLSVVELSLYESSVKLYAGLTARGIEPGSPEWNKEVQETMDRQRKAMAPRLWPEIPERRYICFYPMDRKRGETRNWYDVSIEERGRMMHDHGLVGRKYADDVKQIITGSIGLDDWEWGVDLFADDPLVFKRLIYEMRFDEASAIYALFGTFYVGIRVKAAEFTSFLEGEAPLA